MRFEHEAVVPAAPDLVFRALQDVPLVVSCIPGASVTGIVADDRYAGDIGVRYADMGITFRGTFDVVRESTERLHIAATGAGGDHLAVRSSIDLVLSPDPAGTKVALAVELDFSGALSGLARSAARATCPALLRSFAGNLTTKASSVVAT